MIVARDLARLIAVLALLQGPGTSQAAEGDACISYPRVLVVGIDGGDWDLIDPMREGGYVPTLERLIEGGARGDLNCVPAFPNFSCICPPVWTSLATGQPRSVHGMTEVLDEPAARGVKAIWNVLAENGGENALFSYRNTWPPTPDMHWILTQPGLDFAAFFRNDVWGMRHAGFLDVANHSRPESLVFTLGLVPFAGETPPLWAPFASDRASMEGVIQLDQMRNVDGLQDGSADPADPEAARPPRPRSHRSCLLYTSPSPRD